MFHVVWLFAASYNNWGPWTLRSWCDSRGWVTAVIYDGGILLHARGRSRAESEMNASEFTLANLRVIADPANLSGKMAMAYVDMVESGMFIDILQFRGEWICSIQHENRIIVSVRARSSKAATSAAIDRFAELRGFTEQRIACAKEFTTATLFGHFFVRKEKA